jgi:hypothetical protein
MYRSLGRAGSPPLGFFELGTAYPTGLSRPIRRATGRGEARNMN